MIRAKVRKAHNDKGRRWVASVAVPESHHESIGTEIGKYTYSHPEAMQAAYAMLADLDALTDLCGRRGLRLIEDCAHAHGTFWRGDVDP